METNGSLTTIQFVINLLNSCIGIGILTKPYGIAISGYYSIISIIMAFVLITYSSYCITKVTLNSYNFTTIQSDDLSTTSTNSNDECINIDVAKAPINDIDTIEEHNNKTQNKSVYTVISVKALGTFGAFYGTFGFILSAVVFLVNIIVMNCDLISDIISVYVNDHNPNLIYLYSIIIVFPFIFVLNWKGITFIGWIGTISVAITTIVIVYVFIAAFINFKHNNGTVPTSYFPEIDDVNSAQYAKKNMNNIELIFFTFVTFIGGMNGNGSIPMLIVSSKSKGIKQLTIIISVSYGIVALFYVCVGILGYHVYGGFTYILILNNLFIWPSHIIAILVSVVMIINLCASYGLFSNVAADIIEGIVKVNKSKRCNRILVRLFILCVSAVFGFISKNNLSLLTAIQGCVAAVFGSALVIPFLLYLGMFWKQISIYSRIIHILLLLCVFSIAMIVSIAAISDFLSMPCIFDF